MKLAGNVLHYARSASHYYTYVCLKVCVNKSMLWSVFAIAGSIYLTECPAESFIPIYLIVMGASVLGGIFFIYCQRFFVNKVQYKLYKYILNVLKVVRSIQYLERFRNSFLFVSLRHVSPVKVTKKGSWILAHGFLLWYDKKRLPIQVGSQKGVTQ